jgi:uncharacterized protein (DUF302 family)
MNSNCYAVECVGTFEEVCKRLTSNLPKHKLGLVGSIDLKSKLKEKGLDFARNCTIFEVCNPQVAYEMLTKDAIISTMLPCRISVYEENDKIKMATALPTSLLHLFKEFDGVTESKMIEEALKATLNECTKSEQ